MATKENLPLGVDPSRTTSLPVRVDATVNLWEVKPQPELGLYRLSLVDAFPYIGVVDGIVVATLDEQLVVNWHVGYHAEFDAYTTEEKALWPTPAWTLESYNPKATVTIRLFEIIPAKRQLWTFVRVYE